MIINKNKLIENGQNRTVKKIRKDILNALEYTVHKIGAENSVKSNINKLKSIIKEKQPKNIYLIAVGKASVQMAQTILKEIDIKDGIIITNKQCPSLEIPCIQSTHPVPSYKSQKAAELAIDTVKKASDNDLIVFLISGGGSALAELPRIGIEDLQITTDLLIKHNLSINEINCIRRHLSAIKGGQIIKYTKAHIVSFIISDVIGNDLSTIASGLTYFDDTTFKDALNIIKKHKLSGILPKSVVNFLTFGKRESETTKKDNFPFDRVNNFIITDNDLACFYAESFLKSTGYKTVSLSKKITQEVKEAAKTIIESAVSIKEPLSAIVSGGEPTVLVKGNGIGGRNLELALILADRIENMNAVFLSFATDGKDGNSPAAGAIIDGYTKKRAEKLSLNIEEYLSNNNSYGFFNKLGDCIFTKDTHTNVADIQIFILY